MSSNNWYFHRASLEELVAQTGHHTTANNHLDTIKDDMALVKAELFYLNNSNVANCASHSLLQANSHHQTTHGKIDSTNTLLTTQQTHNTNLLSKNGLIYSELAYLNNSSVPNCASHSLLQANSHHQTTHGKIDSTNTLLTTQQTHNTNLLSKNGSIYSELAYANNTGASGSLAHSGVQLLALSTPQGSQANLMSAVSCVAAGTESSVVDFGATSVPNKIQVLCKATSSVSGNGYEIYGSIDNTNWCVVMMFNGSKTIPLSISNSAGGTINSQSSFICDWCCRYVKIKVYCLATFNASVVGLGR